MTIKEMEKIALECSSDGYVWFVAEYEGKLGFAWKGPATLWSFRVWPATYDGTQQLWDRCLEQTSLSFPSDRKPDAFSLPTHKQQAPKVASVPKPEPIREKKPIEVKPSKPPKPSRKPAPEKAERSPRTAMRVALVNGKLVFV